MHGRQSRRISLSFKVLEIVEGYYVMDLQEFSQTAPTLYLQTLLHIYTYMSRSRVLGFNTYKCPVESSDIR